LKSRVTSACARGAGSHSADLLSGYAKPGRDDRKQPESLRIQHCTGSAQITIMAQRPYDQAIYNIVVELRPPLNFRRGSIQNLLIGAIEVGRFGHVRTLIVRFQYASAE